MKTATKEQDKPVFNEELQRPPTDQKMVYGTEEERWAGVMGLFGELVTIVRKLADHPSLGISHTQVNTMAQHWDALHPHPAEKKTD